MNLVLTVLVSLTSAADATTLAAPCNIAGGVSRCQVTEMNSLQLWELIQQREALGQSTFELWTALHLKLALPLATFFTTLLVAPLALLVAKFGSSVSTAISIVLVFAWYVIYSIFGPLGQAGAVAPFIAGWIQNLLFAGLGLSVWAYLNRDRLMFWHV